MNSVRESESNILLYNLASDDLVFSAFFYSSNKYHNNTNYFYLTAILCGLFWNHGRIRWVLSAGGTWSQISQHTRQWKLASIPSWPVLGMHVLTAQSPNLYWVKAQINNRSWGSNYGSPNWDGRNGITTPGYASPSSTHKLSNSLTTVSILHVII